MVLGIDIGSMAVSAVLLDAVGEIRETFYEFHEGQIGRVLQKLADSLESSSGESGNGESGNGKSGSMVPGDPDPAEAPLIALTSSSRLSIKSIDSIDIQTALVRASHYPEQSPDYILHVGAEKFFLIKRGADGKYESSRTNTSCAAGTGSFLDQQSRRLQIPSIEEF